MYNILVTTNVFDNSLIPDDETEIKITCWCIDTLFFREPLPAQITTLFLNSYTFFTSEPIRNPIPSLTSLCCEKLKRQNVYINYQNTIFNVNKLKCDQQSDLQMKCHQIVKNRDNFFPWELLPESVHQNFNCRILPPHLRSLIVEVAGLSYWLQREITLHPCITYLSIKTSYQIQMTLPPNVTEIDNLEMIKNEKDCLKLKRLTIDGYLHEYRKYANIEHILYSSKMTTINHIPIKFNKLTRCDVSISIVSEIFDFSFPLLETLILKFYNNVTDFFVANLEISLEKCYSLKILELEYMFGDKISIKILRPMKIIIRGDIVIINVNKVTLDVIRPFERMMSYLSFRYRYTSFEMKEESDYYAVNAKNDYHDKYNRKKIRRKSYLPNKETYGVLLSLERLEKIDEDKYKYLIMILKKLIYI